MPKSSTVSNIHIQYDDVTSQHWHPDSAHFAGGDHLMTALDSGWAIDKCVLVKHWYAGMRSVNVYEFTLLRNEITMVMPVIANPYIHRLLGEASIEVDSRDDDDKETV